MVISPPRPPSPPLGPPRGTYFSRRNARQPLPPSPAFTRIVTSSINNDFAPYVAQAFQPVESGFVAENRPTIRALSKAKPMRVSLRSFAAKPRVFGRFTDAESGLGRHSAATML